MILQIICTGLTKKLMIREDKLFVQVNNAKLKNQDLNPAPFKM